MFDPNEYNSQPSLSESHEADSWATKSGFIGTLRSLLILTFQWYIWKFLFYGTILVLVSTLGIYSWTVKDIKEVSTHLASGGLEPVTEKITKVAFKSTVLNRHPIYQTLSAKDFQETVGVPMRDVYQYAVVDKKDIFVMKDVWFRDGKPLEIEYSNLISEDAMDLCDSQNAYPATEKEVKSASVVQRPQEGFFDGGDDGWSGKKMFRCIIDLGGAE